MLKGIQRTSPCPNKSKRLPITPHLLERIHALWSKEQLSFDKTMLWAAFCLSLFGFMRSGEYIGRTGTVICPVSALLAHLAIRSPSPGPLFIFQDGTPLSRQQLVAYLHSALAGLGVDVANYLGHSFRIGAASTAARAGFSDTFIQTLGR